MISEFELTGLLLQGCVLWGFDQPATAQLSAILSRIVETEDCRLASLYISGLSWAAVNSDLVARAALRLQRLRQWLYEKNCFKSIKSHLGIEQFLYLSVNL